MGRRSADGAPNCLPLRAAAQGLEAAGLIVVIAANLIDLADGAHPTRSGAIAIIAIEAIVAIGVAWIAAGIVRVQPWTRTPAIMTQAIHDLHRHLAAGSPPACLGPPDARSWRWQGSRGYSPRRACAR